MARPKAGFTTSDKPWLPVPDSYKTVNVAEEVRQDDSLLNWYKQLIQLRRDNPALHSGKLTLLNTEDTKVLSWMRQAPGAPAVVVACNFTAEPQKFSFDLSKQGISSRAGEDADEDAGRERSGIARCGQPAAVRRLYRTGAVGIRYH